MGIGWGYDRLKFVGAGIINSMFNLYKYGDDVGDDRMPPMPITFKCFTCMSIMCFVVFVLEATPRYVPNVCFVNKWQ